MVGAPHELKSAVYAVLFDNSADYVELSELRLAFAKVMDIYMTTEWKRIKLKTVGKVKKGGKSYQIWEVIWKANEEYYGEVKAKE